MHKYKVDQWHLVAFFSRKIIPAETWYTTHNQELLIIVETFKTWHYCLEDCKHKILVFINQNNLCQLIEIKSLSSRQVCWAQELSQYSVWLDYCQGEPNEATDALSRFLQKH